MGLLMNQNADKSGKIGRLSISLTSKDLLKILSPIL